MTVVLVFRSWFANNMMLTYFLFILTLCTFCNCNKYSEKMNSPEYHKLLTLEKPFRMQRLNLLWEKATKRLPVEKLKLFYSDMKYQDKEELAWKKTKAEGLDKGGLKEGLILASFKAILEKYNLQDDFKALQDATLLSKPSIQEASQDTYFKSVFRDKKLNKLWLKAEQQGFTEDQLLALKEEFLHHQNKIDQYYQMINQLHTRSDEDLSNTVEQILHAEVGEKLWKSDNPQQMLKEKHSELKSGYEYLNTKVLPNTESGEFEELQVKSLWEIAKNTSFTPHELESLKKELYHFEHKLRKLKHLNALELERDDSNIVVEVAAKKNKKLKEYTYKVEKLQKELITRIVQKHSEL